MKRLIGFLMAFAFVFGLAGCAITVKPQNPTEEPTSAVQTPGTDGTTTQPGSETPDPATNGTVYPLDTTATWAKKLGGRMEATAEGTTCDWSADGIEFVATCKGDVTFDLSVTTKLGGGVSGCSFRAYVDGEAYLNGTSPYYEVHDGNAKITLQNLSEGTHTVRLVKATGYTLANTLLKSVTLDGTVAAQAPANNPLYIEFIGDSISCGWGVVGNHDGAYTAQDATLAYPYLLANRLNADYSVVALSGQGLLKGAPGIPMGYRYASPNRSAQTEFAFERKPDIIVINVDTNDVGTSTETEFQTALQSFVTYVREKNGNDCKIILVTGVMRTNFSKNVQNVVNDLGGKEQNYYLFSATTAAGGKHPTVEEHAGYTDDLVALLAAIESGEYGQPQPKTIPEMKYVLLSQDFNSAETAADAGIACTVTPDANCTAGTGLPLSIADGKLVVGKHAWHKNADYYATLVSPAQLGGAGTYLLEMDLTFNELAIFTLLLNGDRELTSNPDSTAFANNRVNSIAVSIRQMKGAGSYGNGTVKNPVIVNYISFDGAGGGQKTVSAERGLLDITEEQASVSFKLSILVEEQDGGCTVTVFINGEYSSDYTYPAAYNATANSAVILWAQDTSLTIDNLKVSSPSTVLFSENYNATDYDVSKLTVEGASTAVLSVSEGKLIVDNSENSGESAVVLASGLNQNLSDYTVEATFTYLAATDSKYVALAGIYTAADQYIGGWVRYNGRINFEERKGGSTYSPVSTTSYTTNENIPGNALNVSYTVKVHFHDQTADLYVNGFRIFSGVNSIVQSQTGKIGIMVKDGVKVSVDNVKVTVSSYAE